MRALSVSPDSVRKELKVPYCIMHLEELAKEEECEDLTVESTLNAATFISHSFVTCSKFQRRACMRGARAP